MTAFLAAAPLRLTTPHTPLAKRLCAALLLLVAAGCGTTSPAPPSATADAAGLAAYLEAGGVWHYEALGAGHVPVEGAEGAVYRLSPMTGPTALRTAPRDADYRTAADVGLGGSEPIPGGVRHGGFVHVHVYTFDGPADLGRIRDALGARVSRSVAYVDGSLAVVTLRGADRLNRLLLRAFGDPKTL